jgi:O-antigen/teichoic acid export membrane protein
MIHEAQITLRNVGLLLAQRNLHLAGNFLFAALVPRLIGPGDYGRYALLTSLAIWFALFSHVGFQEVMARFFPQFRAEGDEKSLRKLFNSLLTVSLVSGSITTGLYFLLTVLWLRDLDLLLLATMASTVLIRGVAHPFFTLFLGLNQAARWGMAEIFRRWFSIVFLISGFYLNGLQGACLGLLLTELAVLSIGFWWGRPYLSRSDMRLDISYLTPYLQFGLAFFTIHLVLTAFQYSGEILVRLFNMDYIQIAYFALAYNVFQTIASTIPKFTLAFAPLMTIQLAKGETEALRDWVKHLIKWLAIGGVWVTMGIVLLGKDLVPLVLGGAYHAVTTNLLVLSFALFSLALSNVATLLTIVYNYPKIALRAGGIRLAAFWVLGIPFVIWWGSLGACLAVLCASVLYGGYFTWRIQRRITYSLQPCAWAIALGLFFLPLWWFQSSWVINALLYVVFVVGYCTVLLVLRIVTLSEVTALGRAFRSKNVIFNASKSVGKEHLDR